MRLRIKELREERSLTLEQLAELADISVSYLSRIQNSNRPINSKWIGRIAHALGVRPEELFSGQPSRMTVKLQTLPVIGRVQAGEWVEAMEWPPEEQYLITVPVIPKARNAFGLLVSGPSMNKVFKDGATAICVPILDFWREIGDEDYVVCQRTKGDGLIEATIKQLVLNSHGRAWLWPRSDDPDYQTPIAIPWPQVTDFTSTAAEFIIRAVVVGVFQFTLTH